MKQFKKIAMLSILTLIITACSSRSGNGEGSASGTATSNTTNMANSNSDLAITPIASSTTGNTQIFDFNVVETGKNYQLQYTPITTSDNRYLSPTVTTISENDIYNVKPVASADQSVLTEMVNYTNQLRLQQGLSALEIDQGLMAIAQRRAEELVGRFSHTRPDGSEPSSLLNQKIGFAENISAGQATAQLAMTAFEGSATHYPSMVNANYTKTGVGFVYVPGSEYTYYWVQVFADSVADTNYYLDTNAEQYKLLDVTAKTANIKDRLTWMVVDDTPLYLAKFEPNGEWYSFSQSGEIGTYEGLINGYQQVRFGLAQKSSDAHKVFYRGNNTDFDNMPQSGTATYTGKGVITDGSTSRYLNSTFQADFANKQLNGVLSENGIQVTDIQAIIRGSSFHSPQDANVEVQGGFFGTSAEELGGVFYDYSTEQYGAFGGKK